MSDDVNKFLLGGGAPSAKFKKHGDTCSGRVVSSEMRQQTNLKGEPLVWKDGSPRMQAVVTLATDETDPEVDGDDGTRRLFVKGAMQKAVGEAIRRAGANSIEAGATLAVQYIGDGEAQGAGYDPPKLYRAQYRPPAVRAGDLLGGNGNGESAGNVVADDLLPE